MLLELNVENIAIVERVHVELGSGFTAFTGETGAGKSLLVDAIGLALGERADAELVRKGASKGVVGMVLDLSQHPEAVARCEAAGVDLEEGRLFAQRELTAEGRSVARLNGRMTPVGTLREIAASLVDLHGQHQHQSLLDPACHLPYLDAWIGESALSARREVASAFAIATDLRRQARALRDGLREREQRLDMLRFQIQEIETTDPKPGELSELQALIARLRNVEHLSEAAQGALDQLREADGSALERLSGSLIALDAAQRFDPALAGPIEPLREALFSLEEGLSRLRSYADLLESDPERLENAAGRLDLLMRLRRKYGEDEQAILELAERARREVEALEEAEENQETLGERLTEAERLLAERVSELSMIRHERSAPFDAVVQDQLRDLSMEKGAFVTRIKPKDPDETGGDAAEFFFSANMGESPRPLAKIASGGEVSRVMLALKVALSGKAGVPTLIFDEVDTGLGGRAAASVARKLAELARSYQVIVISHLPQIAGKADRHYRIEKSAVAGRSVSTVHLLGPEERVEEIARMLSGDRISDNALASARDLLEV